MIEVFQGDVFDVEVIFEEPLKEPIYIVCDIVDNENKGRGFDKFELVKITSTSFIKTLSAKNLKPSKKFAPYKHYIRIAIKDEYGEKESTVYQEELFVKEIYKAPITVTEGE